MSLCIAPINRKISNKVMMLAQELRHIPNGKNKHMSFIVERNNVLSIGFNSYTRTHPFARNFNFKHGGVHSEIDSYLRVRWMDLDFSRCDLINVRLNFEGTIRMAKPCVRCLHFIDKVGFKRIWYTNEFGEFTLLRS